MATPDPRRPHRPDDHARRVRRPAVRPTADLVVGARYLGIAVALVYALFPIVFIVSAALNPGGTLTTSRR